MDSADIEPAFIEGNATFHLQSHLDQLGALLP